MERERAVWQCLLATDCKLFAYQKLPARAITKIILYENEQLSREKEREKERERGGGKRVKQTVAYVNSNSSLNNAKVFSERLLISARTPALDTPERTCNMLHAQWSD